MLGWTKLTNRLCSNGSGASVEFTEENCCWGKCWGISYPNTLESVLNRPITTELDGHPLRCSKVPTGNKKCPKPFIAGFFLILPPRKSLAKPTRLMVVLRDVLWENKYIVLWDRNGYQASDRALERRRDQSRAPHTTKRQVFSVALVSSPGNNS